MNLSDIDIKLAERTNPQAINLGFVTARRYFPKLFCASLLASAPLLIVAVSISYFYQSFFWGSFLLWWGKPYVDRVILLNASRLLFREKIGWRDIVASLGGAFKHGLWLNLTFFRLSGARCLTLPIMVLEHLSGNEYGQRRKLLMRGSRSVNSVTVGLVHFDVLLYMSLTALLLMLVPDTMNPFNQGLNIIFTAEEFTWLFWVMLFFQVFCSAVIEVFYVMTGFMMYLNSRIKTEGWHIDIGFKQIAERLIAQSTMKRARPTSLNVSVLAPILAPALLLTLAFSGITLPKTASAENIFYETKQLIDEAQGDFERQETEKHFQVTPQANRQTMRELLLQNDPFEVDGKWKANETKDKPKDSPLDIDLNTDRFDFNAGPIVKIVLLALGVGLLLWLFTQRQHLSRLFTQKPRVQIDDRPSVMFGLDIRRESLPSDIASEAMRLFQRGKIQAALSLLYRGSLTALVHDYDLDIKESDTEGDCLRNAKARVSNTTFDYFSDLTNIWQSVIYAHRHPDTAHIESLINGFNRAFIKTQGTQVSSSASSANAHGGQQ